MLVLKEALMSLSDLSVAGGERGLSCGAECQRRLSLSLMRESDFNDIYPSVVDFQFACCEKDSA